MSRKVFAVSGGRPYCCRRLFVSARMAQVGERLLELDDDDDDDITLLRRLLMADDGGGGW